MRQYFKLIVKILENKGRAVFTDELIPENSIIEVAPVIKINSDIVIFSNHKKFSLNEHLYKSNKDNDYFLVLGYGSLYNHNDNENIIAEYDEKIKCYKFISKRDILPNEELCINYGYKREGWI